MTDQKAELELKTLYQITGNTADINTVLINRGEFRNLRALVAELEAQLESIGAGGVGPLMQAANSKHVEQPLGMVAMPRAVAEQTLDTLNTVEWSVVESCWIVDGERIDSAINTLRAVLEQPDTGIPASVLDDWKLVPVEPTQAMLRAAIDAPRPAVYVDSLSAAENLINSTKYRAMLDAAPQPPASKDPNWPKLEKPARVGGGTFGIGTSSKHVVDAAQRAHDEHVRAGNLTHEQMAEEERKRRALWDMINGSPEESKPKFVWQAQGEQEPDAFYEWWGMRPSLTRLQAWLIWKDERKQPERAHGIGQTAAPQPPKDENSAVVFTAPQGWGKTRDAKHLLKIFGLNRLVDDWTPGMPIQDRTLHLTNVPPDELVRLQLSCRVIAKGWPGRAMPPKDEPAPGEIR